MLKKTCALALLAAASTFGGCTYANVTYPLDTDLYNTELGDKTGESSSYSVLGLVAWGDSGMKAAAEAGSIKTLLHADQNTLAILGFLFTRQTTIVYGK